MARRFSLIGPGRAGRSLQIALTSLGWECVAVFEREDDISHAADDVELCVIATPDGAIANVAESISPTSAVVMHLSGATPLAALGDHRAAALHPLTSLASSTTGAELLRSAYFGVAGEPLAQELAEALSGKWFVIEDADRALYHATAAVAANHLVALLGQVERMATEIDIPFEAFLALVHSSVANTAELGPTAALTGPAARGDEATINSHRDAISSRLPSELDAYDVMLALARRLASPD